jgi:hypothetical protein
MPNEERNTKARQPQKRPWRKPKVERRALGSFFLRCGPNSNACSGGPIAQPGQGCN